VLPTVPIWAVEARATWSVCCAIGVDLEPPATLSLLGSASLGTPLSTASGYVGSYQFAFVVIPRQLDIGPAAAIRPAPR